MQKYTLSSNSEVIKKLIGEYVSGAITIIYGNAASGKTTTCLLATLQAAKKDQKVVYVDTEGGFNPARLAQLGGSTVYNILDNIFLMKPKSFEEQHDTILNLNKLCSNDKIKLIIIDTIGNHYRVSLNEDPKLANSMMTMQLTNLIRIARDLNKIVIITNQARAKMETQDEIAMIGGNFIAKAGKCIIELNKKDQNRFATLVKYKTEHENTSHYNIGKKLSFEIKEKGLFLK